MAVVAVCGYCHDAFTAVSPYHSFCRFHTSATILSTAVLFSIPFVGVLTAPSSPCVSGSPVGGFTRCRRSASSYLRFRFALPYCLVWFTDVLLRARRCQAACTAPPDNLVAVPLPYRFITANGLGFLCCAGFCVRCSLHLPAVISLPPVLSVPRCYVPCRTFIPYRAVPVRALLPPLRDAGSRDLRVYLNTHFTGSCRACGWVVPAVSPMHRLSSRSFTQRSLLLPIYTATTAAPFVPVIPGFASFVVPAHL